MKCELARSAGRCAWRRLLLDIKCVFVPNESLARVEVVAKHIISYKNSSSGGSHSIPRFLS